MYARPRRCRQAGLLAVVLGLVTLLTAPAARAQPSSSVEQQLAERFAPIVMVDRNDGSCGDGKPFHPAPVSSVLGRSDVKLVAPDGSVVTTAPAAADLFRLGDGYHLDLPGNPLDPGCTYQRWWESIASENPPTTYARVATDPEHPGKIALQYWFWWVLNDWNDKHEGDWEMIQLVFDESTAEAALASEPTLAMYAQHEGGQYKEWSNPGLQREGDHVFAYPASGSHADYFEANRWFGKSSQTGFGCDSTEGPFDRTEPAVVLMPSSTEGITAADPFAWLTFEGRWGQKEPSFNNGPQGPNTKLQWDHPITWVDSEGRTSAVAVPAVGNAASNLFCSVATTGSLLFIGFLDTPWQMAIFLLVVIVALALVVRATRWRPAEPMPVQAERRAGQLFTAALVLQRRHIGTYARLGLVVLVGGLGAVALERIVLALTRLGDVAETAGASSGWSVPVALLAGSLVTLPVLAFTRAASTGVVADLAEGRDPSFRSAARWALEPAGGFLTALFMLLLLGAGLAVLLLFPVVVWLLARWAVATPSAVADRTGVRGGLRESSRLTKHHRLRSLAVTAVANIVMNFVGPLVGMLALVATSFGFGVVNLLTAVVNMVLVPWAGTVLGLMREDLLVRHAAAEAAPAEAAPAEGEAPSAGH